MRLAPLTVLALAPLLSGCMLFWYGDPPDSARGHGSNLLEKYAVERSVAAGRGLWGAPDRGIAANRAAAVPAPVGLVRIVNGRPTAIPKDEAGLWALLAERTDAVTRFAPLVPEPSPASDPGGKSEGRPAKRREASTMIPAVLESAAQEGLETVLVYELDAACKMEMTPLSPLELTFVLAFVVPSTLVTVDGYGTAALVDGPSGDLLASTSAEASRCEITRAVRHRERRKELCNAIDFDVVEALVPKLEALMDSRVAAPPRTDGRGRP